MHALHTAAIGTASATRIASAAELGTPVPSARSATTTSTTSAAIVATEAYRIARDEFERIEPTAGEAALALGGPSRERGPPTGDPSRCTSASLRQLALVLRLPSCSAHADFVLRRRARALDDACDRRSDLEDTHEVLLLIEARECGDELELAAAAWSVRCARAIAIASRFDVAPHRGQTVRRIVGASR